MDESHRQQNPTPVWTRSSTSWVVALWLTAIVLPIGWDLQNPSMPGCLFISTCVSIYASMGLWLGFGDSRLRLIVVAAATLLLTRLTWYSLGGPQSLETFLVLLFFAWLVIGVVAGPIAVARVVRHGILDKVQDNSERSEVLQFQIIHLFVLTTAVAVLTLLVQALWPYLSDNGGQNEWLLVFKLGLTLGVCSLVVIWSTLGRDALLRTVVSALVALGLASTNYWIIRSSIGWLWLTMTLIVWGQTTVLMWLVRLQGFRFVSDSIRTRTSS